MGIVGGIIGAIGNIGSAIIGSDAASSAADAQIQAANQASATELAMFNQTQANEAPYMAAGGNALAALMYGMGLSGAPGAPASVPTGTVPSAGVPSYGGSPYGGPSYGYGGGGAYGNDLAYPSIGPQAYQGGSIGATGGRGYGYSAATPAAGPPPTGATPSAGGGTAPYGGNIGFGSLTAPFTAAQFQASPGYQYDVNQMMQAVQNSAAARGGLVGGNTLQALQQNAFGLANQDWYNAQNAYYGHQDQLFNMLQTLAGGGQNAAGHLGALGSQVAGQIGGNIIGAGNSAAAGSVAQGQIWSNLLNNQSFLNGITSLFGGGGGGIPAPDLNAGMDVTGMDPSVLGYMPGGLG